MAFSAKTWVGRVVQYPGRVILTKTGNTDEYDPTRSEGIITTAGDQLSPEALNDMEQRILSAFTGTTVAGVPLNGSPTVAQLISAGLCPAPEGPLPWTPTLYGSTTTGSPTYTVQEATYYKVGKLVIAIINALNISSKGGMGGNILIGGLPFVALSRGALFISTTINTTISNMAGEIGAGSNKIDLAVYASTVAVTDTGISDMFGIYGAVAVYLTSI